MHILVTVKHLGATAHKGHRLKASATYGGKVFTATESWDHALDPENNVIEAARVAALGALERWNPDGLTRAELTPITHSLCIPNDDDSLAVVFHVAY